MIQLFNDDCLKVMNELPEQSIDAVICDPPYGTTACRWDAVIPLDEMWEALYRVTKIDSPLVFTCQQPFTSQLVLSNVQNYSHNWVWDKGYSTNFANCNKMPMKGFEDVVVFWRKRGTYNPQGIRPVKDPTKVKKRGMDNMGETVGVNGMVGKEYTSEYENYPNGIIRTSREKTYHPTGKAVALMEYLVLTYTNPGETVLDFTMGSGTTGLACKQVGRSFVGIELSEEYFDIAKDRIDNYNGIIAQLLFENN
tara:strand:+ start:936 stop:1691 length:756 start_codon:yes stop_codon:yes gene_type:complete